MAPPPPPPPPPLLLLLVLVLVLAAARAPGLPPGAAVAAAAAAAATATASTGTASAEAIACDFERECPWRWNASERGFTIASQLPGSDGLPTADGAARLDGHFLLLRGRRGEQREWALMSPSVAATPERNCHLAVDLHMANMNAGSVKAVVAANSTSWVVSERSGNDRRRWEQVNFNLGSISQEFLIILEIVTSGATPSHVALDNIALLDCFPKLPSNGCDTALKFRCGDNSSCLVRDQVCDVNVDCPGGDDEEDSLCDVDFPATEPRCSFEKGWCGWNNTVQKPFAWTLHRGASASNITGPPYDHTYGNASGTYLYLNMSLAVMFGEEAVLQSPIFYPPPSVVDNSSSPYYHSCKMRFYYHHFGRHSAALELRVVELGPRAQRETELWSAYGTRLNHWYLFTVELPPIAHRYFFRFEARRGMGGLGDQGLDDISLSPECFGNGIPKEAKGSYVYGYSYIRNSTMKEPHPDFINKTYYMLTPCGIMGRLGPQPSNCEQAPSEATEAPSAASVASATSSAASAASASAAEAAAEMAAAKGMAVRGSVVVLAKDPFKGVQRWTAPEGGYYTLLAKGASGGAGATGGPRAKGAAARLVVELRKGEVLYVLVGQEGSGACSKYRKCTNGGPGHQAPKTSLNQRLANELPPTPGGGGGGGATYVFKLNENWTGAQPLVVAAGGGGVCDGCPDTGRQHGRGASAHAEEHLLGAASLDPPLGEGSGGSGGGWRRPADLAGPKDVEGRSLLSGGAGGMPCSRDLSGIGGFGGGGSGCRGGGGGGGYVGGRGGAGPANVTSLASMGEGGLSYVGQGFLGDASAGAHEGPGEVLIVPAVAGCRCDYRCVALDEYRSVTQCICPERWKLAPDNVSCVSSGDPTLPTIIWLVMAIVAIILLFIALGGTCFCLYNRYQRKKVSLPRQQVLSDTDLQLNRIRPRERIINYEYNPNYEFGGGTYSVHDLKDIPRDQLRLVKALGQGAFGEVYQGFYRQRSGDAVEMPVAVKTLPELSTNQAETDFLMEALIMSKFNHPNIVHFIGVCFDKHPRFIVLELLAGGDLKSFLRESRPKPERPSPLTMRDLLRCAIDVAKGCDYMENNRFIHRDIAARNCLLTTKGPGRVVKIADFGMARDIYRADYYRKGGKAMLPIKWMPPEAFLDGIFTSKTDVWSFGVLLWEIMSLGFMPYTGCTNREVMQLVTSGGRLEPPSNCPGPLYGVMTQCWHPNPDERPSFSTIMERLGYCMQDPDVVNAPLPTFNRPPSTERDATIMRPPDSDTECLRVQRAAADYLVPLPGPASAPASVSGAASAGAASPASSTTCACPGGSPGAADRLPASPSASSVDKLLGGSNDWETSFVLPESRSTQPLLEADGGLSSGHGSPALVPAPAPAPASLPAAEDDDSVADLCIQAAVAAAAAAAAAAGASPGRNHNNNNNNNSSNHNNNKSSSVANVPPLAPPAAFKSPMPMPLALDAASLAKGPMAYVNVSMTPTRARPAAPTDDDAAAGRPFTVTEAAAAASRRLIADADISV